MDGFAAFTRHVNPALGRFLAMAGRDARFVRGSGCTLEDDRGQKWTDFVAGFGALPLGHDPQPVRAAIERHLQTGTPSMLVEAVNPAAGALAARLVALAGPTFETAFLCNSGAEAIEAALKTVMLATGRTKIVYAERGYHGTTLGALACMGRGVYRDPFADVVDRLGFVAVPFDDLPSLERALAGGDVAGFLVEPIPMEAGVRIPSAGYLSSAAKICGKYGAKLVLDEVQTGLGRTGRMFAFQHEDAVPDVLVLAKALGGGVVPVGAAVMGEGIWRAAYGTYLRSEIHNTTLGGNALSCAVAEAVLDVITREDFLEHVRARGEHLRTRLESSLADRRCVSRVASRGLLGGVELRADHRGHPWTTWEALGLPELASYPTSGPLIVERLSRRRILAQVCAHDWSVVRIEPPLIVDDATLDELVDALSEAVAWLEENHT
jgi:putrescine aminotransferase